MEDDKKRKAAPPRSETQKVVAHVENPTATQPAEEPSSSRLAEAERREGSAAAAAAATVQAVEPHILWSAAKEPSSTMPYSSTSLNNLQDLRSLLEKSTKKGAVSLISGNKILSASALLSAAVPHGLQQRTKLVRQGKEIADGEDPVLQNLWDLTMKLREGAEHADELLQVGVFDCIASLIKYTHPEKYKNDRYKQDTDALMNSSTGPPSTYHAKLAKQVCSDILDIKSSIGVLHEMCRYRSGCVAIAQHKTCIALLFDIPSDAITMLVTSLLVKYSRYDHKAGSAAPNWGNPMVYNLGMIEQGTIDVFGRILNGLDRQSSLRTEIGKLIQSNINAFESRLLLVSSLMASLMDGMESLSAPRLDHCINLKSSLSKLQEVLANLNSKKPKAWKSSFRIERYFLSLEAASEKVHHGSSGDGDELATATPTTCEKQKCCLCAKDLVQLQMCSRCKTAFYCSRECQKKDWKLHKKNCVKHRGYVPSDSDWHDGYFRKELDRIDEQINEKSSTK